MSVRYRKFEKCKNGGVNVFDCGSATDYEVYETPSPAKRRIEVLRFLECLNPQDIISISDIPIDPRSPHEAAKTIVYYHRRYNEQMPKQP